MPWSNSKSQSRNTNKFQKCRTFWNSRRLSISQKSQTPRLWKLWKCSATVWEFPNICLQSPGINFWVPICKSSKKVTSKKLPKSISRIRSLVNLKFNQNKKSSLPWGNTTCGEPQNNSGRNRLSSSTVIINWTKLFIYWDAIVNTKLIKGYQRI